MQASKTVLAPLPHGAAANGVSPARSLRLLHFPSKQARQRRGHRRRAHGILQASGHGIESQRAGRRQSLSVLRQELFDASGDELPFAGCGGHDEPLRQREIEPPQLGEARRLLSYHAREVAIDIVERVHQLRLRGQGRRQDALYSLAHSLECLHEIAIAVVRHGVQVVHDPGDRSRQFLREPFEVAPIEEVVTA